METKLEKCRRALLKKKKTCLFPSYVADTGEKKRQQEGNMNAA